MNKSFYGSLAISNIKKNARGYIPYMITCVICIMLFYIMMAIVNNPDVTKMLGGVTLKSLLAFGAWIIGFFSAIFLFYTNSFLIKQRKKELALYNILGMAKRHVGKMFFLETLITSVISFVAGIVSGVILGKLVFLALIKLMDVELPMEYSFSAGALAMSLLVFGVIFGIVLLCNLGRIRLSNPMQLMAGSRQGEKEPKTKWILTLLGLIMMGIGYYIALSVKSPLEALTVFFIAVLLVIAGTYLLFITGSIAILKMLRKNKKFYYKTKHFTAVSGMLYRMKRNAAGLASICVLSAMVLVTVSTTVSLQAGLTDVVGRNLPDHIRIDWSEAAQQETQERQELKQQVREALEAHDVRIQSTRDYTYTSTAGTFENGELIPSSNFSLDTEVVEMQFIPLAESSEASEYGPLAKDEVLVGGDLELDSDELKIAGLTFKVKDQDSDFTGAPEMGSIASSCYIVVADRQVQEEISKGIGENLISAGYYIGVNINEADWDKVTAAEGDFNLPEGARCDDYQDALADFQSIYGGLLFVGIFLGLLFLMATVLIIYYKQITEGYEDRERYQIMQKVGMSLAEVKQSIRSQILLVFFLPLAVAVIHVAAAFNMMSKLLLALQLPNVWLFALFTAITILVFIVIYVAVYGLTAREYYKLVK
ncbi:ABC transporter permease [bacterium 210820-DFI.6.37]|nr:ABC transporter permease [bacterium 210820-DFI.6.37]